MIRIAHLIKGMYRSGAESLLVEGLRVADRSRFDFTYAYFIAKYHGVDDDLRDLGAYVKCFDVLNTPAMMLSVHRVADYLRESRIDLVHAHLPVSGVVAALAARRARIPVVYTEHTPVEPYHIMTRLALRATWGMQTRVIAVSPDVAESVRVNGGRRAKVQVVMNGIDTDRFAPGITGGMEVRTALGIPHNAPVIGTVASLRAQKRIDIWLAAMRQIIDRIPQAHAVIVGGGEMRDAVEREVSALGLDAAVHLVGPAVDVRPYLACMDVFMMSSEFEGFGLAPVEAMSMCVPVVGTDVPGIRNVIRKGKDGVLVPFDNNVQIALSDAVVALIMDQAMRDKFGEAGRIAAVSRFGIVRMQRELEEIYTRVIQDWDLNRNII